jgi:hypothetical protein
MIETALLARVFVVLGASALLAPVVYGDDNTARRQTATDFVTSTVTAIGLVGLAYWLYRAELPFWAAGSAVFGFTVLIKVCGDLLERCCGESAPRVAWVLLLVGCGGGFLAATEQLEQEALERGRAERVAEEHDNAIASIVRQARTSWQADPTAGVYEIPADPLIAWLAVEPGIDIDVTHEQMIGAAARREIPIAIRLLNNSFSDVDLSVHPDGRLWRVGVERADGTTLDEWSYELASDERLLAPGERRDFEIVWDGADESGVLVPEGLYRVHVHWANAAGAAAPIQIVGEVRLRDAGAIRIGKPDPVREQIRMVQDWAEQQRRMVEMGRMISMSMNQMRLP